jgi:hypothetical protein|nr:MAG TPA: hypothetical protein [Caudoviricetes sp.]
MESLKTDALNNLASVEELADTDLIPVGTFSGNTLKKLTVANMITWLKEKLGINLLNTNLTGKYVLARVDTVTISVADVPAGSITSEKTATFNKVSDDAICIPICRSTGWLICTKYEVNGNKLYAWFGCWSESHSGAGTFDILQFTKVS